MNPSISIIWYDKIILVEANKHKMRETVLSRVRDGVKALTEAFPIYERLRSQGRMSGYEMPAVWT
jgi:hypothetical protein